MQLEDFDYPLPPERIAQQPAEPRDSARLLVDRGARGPAHHHVSDLPDLLEPGDLLVVNDTRVIPGRLRLRRASGGMVEVLLIEAIDADWLVWEAMVRPARRLRDGEVLLGHDGRRVVRLITRTDHGDTFLVEIIDVETHSDVDSSESLIGRVLDRLGEIGEMPLPPYIAATLDQPERYQTVYARSAGSAAAPTAGLHLTEELLERLSETGIGVVTVELMVGRDTFMPITERDPLRHQIHSERYRVDAATLEACHRTRAAGHRVVAVGTTSVRALESAAATGELAGRTSLYIHRGHHWRLVDVMMTNFHLPKTTLLLMIDAFVGERWRTLYTEALRTGYRFASFGDAMLLEREQCPPDAACSATTAHIANEEV